MKSLKFEFPDNCPVDMNPEEWRARQELACCYRLFDAFGWHELIFNHITVRVPGREDQFLINPFGLMYREVCASNLVKIDLHGNIIGNSEYPVNPAGFVVHYAVHASRPDAHAVIHTHTTAGQAVACQQDGLLPTSFPALAFYEQLSYHDFEGVTVDLDESARLATSLGSNSVMILRNHGLLACGPTLAVAFYRHYQLQRACEVQLAAQSGGSQLIHCSSAVGTKMAKQFLREPQPGMLSNSELLYAAMLRWMTSQDASFLA